jgi:DNA-binding transcriptional LysR family regulator
MDAVLPAFDLVDIKHLALMDQLCTTQSVTRSAQALGQSQPTVSIWLAKLRAQLGDPLFVRGTGGMLPTPRALALMPTVREVLAGLRRLSDVRAAFEPATAQRRFAIGMTDASHITLLPHLLAHVRALAPGVSLAATRIDGQLAGALESGEADLGLGYLPGLDAGFYQQTLFAQDWVCLVNARHPRVTSAARARWNLQTYESESHIGISAGTGYHLMDAAVKAQHVQRRVQLELPGFLGLAAILSTNDLVATLPRQIGETLARAGRLRLLPCPFEIPGFTVKQHWHARFHHDAASRWLRGVVAELFMKDQFLM